VDDPVTEPASSDSERAEPPERFDVLRYDDDTHRAVPAGRGQSVVAAHASEVRQRRLGGSLAIGVLPVVAAVGFGIRSSASIGLLIGGGLIVGFVAGVGRYLYDDHRGRIPEIVASGVSSRVVDGYIENFDPETVSDPFG